MINVAWIEVYDLPTDTLFASPVWRWSKALAEAQERTGRYKEVSSNRAYELNKKAVEESPDYFSEIFEARWRVIIAQLMGMRGG